MNTDTHRLDKGRCFLSVFISLHLWFLLAGAQQFDWQKAEREIKRLPPATFKELPGDIVKQLEARGCTIPQSFVELQPHNVIRGQFARPGQTDWAALCSKEGKSSIVMFWGKPTACPAELATADDKTFLQGIGEGRIGYSRLISAVGCDVVLEHYQAHGGPKPPPLNHEGIDAAFAEKASTVHYCYQGKWLTLTGSD